MGVRSSRTAVLAMVSYTGKVTLGTVPRPESAFVEQGFQAEGGWHSGSQYHGLPAYHPQIRPDQTEPS